jgi:hypothetical protein
MLREGGDTSFGVSPPHDLTAITDGKIAEYALLRYVQIQI